MPHFSPDFPDWKKFSKVSLISLIGENPVHCKFLTHLYFCVSLNKYIIAFLVYKEGEPSAEDITGVNWPQGNVEKKHKSCWMIISTILRIERRMNACMTFSTPSRIERRMDREKDECTYQLLDDVLHHLAEGELVFVRRVDVLDELGDHLRVRLRLEHMSTLLLQVRPTTVLQAEKILTS